MRQLIGQTDAPPGMLYCNNIYYSQHPSVTPSVLLITYICIINPFNDRLGYLCPPGCLYGAGIGLDLVSLLDLVFSFLLTIFHIMVS